MSAAIPIREETPESNDPTIQRESPTCRAWGPMKTSAIAALVSRFREAPSRTTTLGGEADTIGALAVALATAAETLAAEVAENSRRHRRLDGLAHLSGRVCAPQSEGARSVLARTWRGSSGARLGGGESNGGRVLGWRSGSRARVGQGRSGSSTSDAGEGVPLGEVVASGGWRCALRAPSDISTPPRSAWGSGVDAIGAQVSQRIRPACGSCDPLQ